MATPQFYQAAKQAGYSDQQINQFLQTKQPKQVKRDQRQPGFQLGEMVRNIPGSALQLGKDILSPILSPVQTAKGLWGLTKGVAAKALVPGEDPEEKVVNDLVNFYADRYGGMDNLLNTIESDPAGFMMDVSTVLGGAGAAAKGLKMGKTAKGLSTASKITDPIGMTGRLGRAGVSRIGKMAGGLPTDEMSRFLAGKARRFTPTQTEAVERAAGMPLEKLEDIYGLRGGASQAGLKRVGEVIAPKQKMYKKLLEGKVVSRKEYADFLLEQAVELEKLDTPQARRQVSGLIDEAAYHSQRADKPLTAMELRDIKNRAFSEASASQIADPFKSGLSEQIGRAGVETLEKVAPGTIEVGKELRGLDEYNKFLRKQAKRGIGGEIFSMFRPGATGAGFGALAGTAVGAPWAGAALGAIGTGIASSPRVQSFASRALKEMPKLSFKAPKLPKTPVYDVNKSLRMITPQSPTESGSMPVPNQQVNTYSPILPSQRKKKLPSIKFTR